MAIDKRHNPDPVTRDRNAYNYQTEVRVRLSETDAVGIVFFGNFSSYMDVGRMDYLNHLQLDTLDGPVRHLAPGAVVHSDVSFENPARYNDVLLISVRCANLGRTSYSFEFLFEQKSNRQVVATGSLTLVWLDEHFKPMEIPESFAETIREFEKTPA